MHLVYTHSESKHQGKQKKLMLADCFNKEGWDTLVTDATRRNTVILRR